MKFTIIIILVILAGLLWYFSIRPNQIKKECAEIALDVAVKNQSEGVGYAKYVYDIAYEVCLKKNALD